MSDRVFRFLSLAAIVGLLAACGATPTPTPVPTNTPTPTSTPTATPTDTPTPTNTPPPPATAQSPLPFDWPITPLTPEQILAVMQCDLDTLPQQRYLQSMTGDLLAAYPPQTACDWAILAVACADRRGEDEPLSEAAQYAFSQAVAANPGFALADPLFYAYFNTVTIARPPTLVQQEITDVRIAYSWLGLGPEVAYTLEIHQADTQPVVTSAHSGTLTIEKPTVQALAPALTDLVPIGSQFQLQPCFDNYPVWSVTLTFADKTVVDVTTDSNFLYMGGPWFTEIDGQAYVQVSAAFAQAVGQLIGSLGLSLGQPEAMFCSLGPVLDEAFPSVTRPPTPVPSLATAPTASPNQTPWPTEFPCTDPLGCVHILPGEPVRIGTMMVVSGPDAVLGVDTLRGVEIAVDDQREILGHRIELAGEDSGCNAEGGQTAAMKLSAEPNLLAIVGPNCSSEARAALPILCPAGIPMVSPSNTAPDMTDPDRPVEYGCYLRTSWSDKLQGTAAADFAWEELGVKKAATIHDGSLWSDLLQQAFADEFEELGGTVTAQEAVSPSDTDMTPALTRIAATEPELIYYPVFIAAGALITQQARRTPGLEEVALLSSDGTFTPDFLSAAGDATLGLYWTSPDFSSYAAEYAEFYSRYQAEYGEEPLAPFHAHAYDAAMMVFAAIEKVAVQDADGTLHIGRQALRDALYATAEFKGLTGTLTCDEYGDCADPRIAVYECVDTDPATWNPGADEDSNPRKVWP